MHFESLQDFQHTHHFGLERHGEGERRTLWVILITAVMMVGEIVAGIFFGSMALLADGLHMGSHAAALAIAFFAYVTIRKYAHDPRFSFGTGKVGSLAGFSSAILLGGFALVMIWESIQRFLNPVPIQYNQAIFVAVIGLVVNAGSMMILGGHGHPHDSSDREKASRSESSHHHHHDHDHNLRAAYLHVLADALTSIFAIIALLGARYFGWVWLDPAIGIVGAVMVSRWAYGLLRSAGAVLLDRQAPEAVTSSIRTSLESHRDVLVADLHVWSIGPGLLAAAISVVTHHPENPEVYRKLLPTTFGIVHSTIEVQSCPESADAMHHGLAAS